MSRRSPPFPLAALALSLIAGCSHKGSIEDDAGGRKPEDFPEFADDVCKPMDGGVALTPDEAKGRNTWNFWCGGNEQFWDRMAREGKGLIDLLRMIDTRGRATRFARMGIINEPGYREAAKPDANGVWLDEAATPEPASIDPKVYGRSTGLLGFRLFDNPDFDDAARKKWDAKRYYSDLAYAADPALVRPYRVGVSCGSCHIAFNPSHPPADPENPKWEDLASAIGNQYIREGAVFGSLVSEGGFFWEMFKVQPAGTSDTSRIATDHINNPNAINPIFELGARASMGTEETLGDDSLTIPGAKKNSNVVHILKDGADSVGIPGATLRVYINIGTYSQHWLQQHNALIGLSKQKPFDIKTAQKHSVYWRATEQKVGNIAKFFTRLKSFRLQDAQGGAGFMTKDPKVVERGAVVFGENCATCHSSKRPPAGADEKAWFRAEAVKPDFRDGNFFSDEKPYPITRIGTNAARAVATNAIRGHVWSEFSSETYKSREAVGEIQVWNPYTDKSESWKVPGGGLGYYRTPSLVCVWSSAPFLHNNALGKFTGDPSLKGRMAAFDDAVEKLLWPEKRLGKESIWRTTKECALQVHKAVIPEPLQTLLSRHYDDDGYFRIGSIPEGTPINLLGNLDPEADPARLVKLLLEIKATVLKIKVEHLDAAAAKTLLRDRIAPDMLALSKCPDLVEDRGHEFGSGLPDDDKRALIEFLKTL